MSPISHNQDYGKGSKAHNRHAQLSEDNLHSTQVGNINSHDPVGLRGLNRLCSWPPPPLPLTTSPSAWRSRVQGTRSESKVVERHNGLGLPKPWVGWKELRGADNNPRSSTSYQVEVRGARKTRIPQCERGSKNPRASTFQEAEVRGAV